MNNKVNKKDLNKVFWRSFALQGAFNYERMQNIGYMYSMLPVIKRVYKDNDVEETRAIQRHLEIFNTTPAVSPFIMGVSAAMEQENSINSDFNEESINAVKASLMGPLAGIGDSIFWGTLRVIAAGIGISFASQGNIVGPLIFLLLYNIPHILVRVFGLKFGFDLGVNSLEKIHKNGVMDKLMSVASIIGLTVVGAMVATMLDINTPLSWNISGADVVVQDILDQILPNLLALVVTFLTFKSIKKHSVAKITVFMLIGGMILHFIGII
ncbi:PTS system, mannose/fructose/sorbose family, IID component [Anaerococcus lactolyticus ATCC 51172]|uniref:PTS system, mannose/fructose/sorbose family, IID component n=1 Tax=Anaerococcus lactolyticus ATCC 51172 TaxID=525254 RepID=C2BGY4_9FIRM|nr:PTS system mannose/fructose/sorbose family transporter subunit IID [Anaerococcus lactolyticus]EEI85847.1 PTS system, mannose/fructose/sorbose family, IID component [Anaerococcus lactolyticus ATCC 51172]